jgi:sulfate/thiosulfate transport system permease protein
MPLHVEVLYNDYAFPAAFAIASLLTLMALATLALKAILEWRAGARLSRTRLH